jgi:hypothetical protein
VRVLVGRPFKAVCGKYFYVHFDTVSGIVVATEAELVTKIAVAGVPIGMTGAVEVQDQGVVIAGAASPQISDFGWMVRILLLFRRLWSRGFRLFLWNDRGPVVSGTVVTGIAILRLFRRLWARGFRLFLWNDRGTVVTGIAILRLFRRLWARGFRLFLWNDRGPVVTSSVVPSSLVLPSSDAADAVVPEVDFHGPEFLGFTGLPKRDLIRIL